MARCPTLRAGVGAAALIWSGSEEVLVDFPAGQVREYADEPYAFSFTIPRPLLERVVADRAVDWSNSLFLSCRFRAWRAGEFNEFLYNFLKSLSVERIDRAEIEAHHKRGVPDDEIEEIEQDGTCSSGSARTAGLTWRCSARSSATLTCHLHGWQFDLDSGRCLTADDRSSGAPGYRPVSQLQPWSRKRMRWPFGVIPVTPNRPTGGPGRKDRHLA